MWDSSALDATSKLSSSSSSSTVENRRTPLEDPPLLGLTIKGFPGCRRDSERAASSVALFPTATKVSGTLHKGG